MYARRLGKLIRKARVRAGLTQEQASVIVGIPQTTLSKYERGVIAPSPEKLAVILDRLAIDDDAYMSVLRGAA